MNVLILGAGQVGRTVLQSLAADINMNVTVVDTDQRALAEVRAMHSCSTVAGHASDPDVLREAGIEDCDAIVAVTASDEVNLVACQVALTLHDTPMRIARIRNLAYLGEDHADLFSVDGIPVDEPISPELTVVNHLKNLVEYQGAVYIAEFADAKAVMTCTRMLQESNLIGLRPSEFASASGHRAHLVGLLRDNKIVHPLSDARIATGDLAFILGRKHAMQELSRDQSGIIKPYRQVVIGGGGHIGMRLAKDVHELSPRRNIKIIEADSERAEQLAGELASSMDLTVLSGDASSEDFLRANDVNDSDLYCAVTNDDLVNVVSSLTAKRLNVRTVFTLVQHVHYLESLVQAGIEIPISPQQTTANIIQRLFREETLSVFRHLALFNLDLFELQVLGNKETSRVVGKQPTQMRLPKGTHLLCLVRGIDAENNSSPLEILPLHAHPDIGIEEGDRAIFLSESSAATTKVEQLFRAKAFKLF
ncbi:MAG: Trk system potassium transporter TrkA [Gammaproteobacteria bacterium]|nr:Trk system potassium transporter TrkA [Gammaproteobacteria bacterium]